MLTKTCLVCSTEKAIDEFYKYQIKNGFNYAKKCKVCTRKAVSENYANRLGHYTEYFRKREETPERKAWRIEKQREYRKKPKYLARVITNNAIRDGRIIKQPCEVCGEAKAQAHHDDYSKPFEIRWLCFKHHREHHKQFGDSV